MSTQISTFLSTLRPAFAGSSGRRTSRGLGALVVVTALGLASCGGGDSSSTDDTSNDTSETTEAPDDSSGLGWSIDAPGTWTETAAGVAEKMWMVADDMGSVNVLTEEFPAGTDIDLQGYLDAAIPQLSSFIDGVEVGDTSFVEGDHQTLAILDYSGTVESTFLWYRAVIGLDAAASKAVIVTFATADKDVYDAEVDGITNVALTLKID